MFRIARDMPGSRKAEWVRLERRLFLKQALSLGALTLLTGCDLTNRESVDKALRAVSRWNARVQAWLFDMSAITGLSVRPWMMVLPMQRGSLGSTDRRVRSLSRMMFSA